MDAHSQIPTHIKESNNDQEIDKNTFYQLYNNMITTNLNAHYSDMFIKFLYKHKMYRSIINTYINMEKLPYTQCLLKVISTHFDLIKDSDIANIFKNPGRKILNNIDDEHILILKIFLLNIIS